MLPADSHVHSQWSWDALSGSMEASCAHAIEIGLPSIAFTEHADFTRWSIPADGVAAMPEQFQQLVRPDGLFHPPPFEVAGYAKCLDRCRVRYPQLRILSGVELGEPHWHLAESAKLLGEYEFDRIVGSVHSITKEGASLVVDRSFATHDANDVVRSYLSEVLCMIRSSDQFTILGHVDYPLRAWPATAGPLAPDRFEDEFRAVLAALAESDRTLEVNTRMLPPFALLTWWREVGGKSLSFGSDAHEPAGIARDFATATAMAEAAGFRADGVDLWARR